VRTEAITAMAKAGYDYVHNYTWDGPGTNASALEYLDACQKLGLQAFIGFDRSKLLAWDEPFVAERVGALSRHPALLAWYLFDEPDLPHQYVPPDQLRALYRLIHDLDPMHPVIVTVAQTNFMPLYHDSYDVYWSMDYGTPGDNARNFDGHRAALKPGTPIMSIVHSYDGKQEGTIKGGDVGKFQPGPQQLRACAFMAIESKRSGLACWWWGPVAGPSRFSSGDVAVHRVSPAVRVVRLWWACCGCCACCGQRMPHGSGSSSSTTCLGRGEEGAM